MRQNGSERRGRKGNDQEIRREEGNIKNKRNKVLSEKKWKKPKPKTKKIQNTNIWLILPVLYADVKD